MLIYNNNDNNNNNNNQRTRQRTETSPMFVYKFCIEIIPYKVHYFVLNILNNI